MRFAIHVTLLFLGSSSILKAQVTLQQPVVETFGVGTTVSVPDRGSVFLGGVSSAASSRTSYGPLRTGTSRGYSLSASSTSASVYVIDIHAMDETILNSVPDTPTPLAIRPRTVTRTDEPADAEAKVKAEKAAKFETLAQQAESAGKPGVAKLHWQMAAKYGSSVAQSKLKPATQIATTAAKE